MLFSSNVSEVRWLFVKRHQISYVLDEVGLIASKKSSIMSIGRLEPAEVQALNIHFEQLASEKC